VTDNAGLSSVDSSKIYPQCSVLPLTLTSLNATSQGTINTISWVTSSEINLVAFEVERSYDGINFERIGRVNARRAPGLGNYSYNDNDHLSGYVYYRLKMIDFSDYYSYSYIVKAFTESKVGNELVANPNPVQNEFVLGARFATAGKITIRLLNTNGALVKQIDAKANVGYNNFTIDKLGAMPAGVYIVELIQNNERRRIKITKGE
jgi:hypothetical protein